VAPLYKMGGHSAVLPTGYEQDEMGSVLALLSCGLVRPTNDDEGGDQEPTRTTADAKTAMADMMRSMKEDKERRLQEALEMFHKGETREAIWRYRVHMRLGSMLDIMDFIVQSMREGKEMRLHSARYEEFLKQARLAVDQEVEAPNFLRSRPNGEIQGLQEALLARIRDLEDERQTESDEVLTSVPDESLEDEDIMKKLREISTQPRPPVQQTTNNTLAAWLRQQKQRAGAAAAPTTRTFSDLSREMSRSPSSSATVEEKRDKNTNAMEEGKAITRKKKRLPGTESPPALAQLAT
jgi:hypothetical protein